MAGSLRKQNQITRMYKFYVVNVFLLDSRHPPPLYINKMQYSSFKGTSVSDTNVFLKYLISG